MRSSLETRLGIFFALAIVALLLLMELAGGLDFFHQGKYLRARFTSIQELKRGDPVKMAGVEIGTVEKIALADEQVEVTMKIAQDARVRTDSRATVRFLGLLGQNYVSVSFGSATSPVAESGAEIQTDQQADFSTVMAKLDSAAAAAAGFATNFNLGNINELLGPLTDFFKQNSPRISGILTNVQSVSAEIASGKGTVGRLIYEDTLYTSTLSAVTNLDSTVTQANDLVTQAKTTLNQITEGQGTIGKLAKDDTLYREATAALTNLREILEKINQGKGSVGPLVNDPSLYRNARLTLQKVEKATESLEDQGPLSVLGTAASSLF